MPLRIKELQKVPSWMDRLTCKRCTNLMKLDIDHGLYKVFYCGYCGRTEQVEVED